MIKRAHGDPSFSLVLVQLQYANNFLLQRRPDWGSAMPQDEAEDLVGGAAEQEGLEGRSPGSRGKSGALAAVLPMMTCNLVPEAIQTAFQVGDTGFATPLRQTLQEASSLPADIQ